MSAVDFIRGQRDFIGAQLPGWCGGRRVARAKRSLPVMTTDLWSLFNPLDPPVLLRRIFDLGGMKRERI